MADTAADDEAENPRSIHVIDGVNAINGAVHIKRTVDGSGRRAVREA